MIDLQTTLACAIALEHKQQFYTKFSTTVVDVTFEQPHVQLFPGDCVD